MQTTTVKLYSLVFANAKTYLAAALFADSEGLHGHAVSALARRGGAGK